MYWTLECVYQVQGALDSDNKIIFNNSFLIIQANNLQES